LCFFLRYGAKTHTSVYGRLISSDELTIHVYGDLASMNKCIGLQTIHEELEGAEPMRNKAKNGVLFIYLQFLPK